MASKEQSEVQQTGPGAVPGREEIEAQLARIVNSKDFDPTARSRSFLRFIVEQVLAGETNSISQYSIATQVLARGDNFDPTSDPIVRIQAGRLRRSLDRYYLTGGATDPVEISVPKGTYVPHFAYRKKTSFPGAPDPAATGAIEHVLREAREWPAVLLTPFRNLTGDPQNDYLAQGLTTELGIELDRYQLVRVYMQEASTENDATSTQVAGAVTAKFRIEGTIEKRGPRLSVLLRLLDGASGAQIWGQTFRCQSDDPKFLTFLDELSLAVAAALADEGGVITRHLIRERRSSPHAHIDCQDAILRFYHFFNNPSPHGFPEVLKAVRRAVELEPDRGLPWSLLARLYGLNLILELGEEDTPVADALQFARKAVQLEPDDAGCRATLSYLCMVFDHLNEARREAEKALSLDPNSLHAVDIIGYLLVLLGDWDRGVALIEKTIQLNPFHARAAHYALWLNNMRTGDYAGAHQEALELGSFGRYWPPLARAAALGHLGRTKEAKEAVEELQQLMPDFAERWHDVLSLFVKFDELIECIVEGLRKAGLVLAPE